MVSILPYGKKAAFLERSFPDFGPELIANE